MNERTQTHILPAAAAGAGILGLLLEVWLLYFSRDDRGLIIPHHPASLLLWVLTLGVIAALFLLTRKVHPRVRSYVRTFPASRMGFAGAVAAAAGIVALVLPELLSSPDTLTLICDILGLAAAAAVSVPLLRAFDVWGAAYATIAGIGVQALCLLAFLLVKCRKQFA